MKELVSFWNSVHIIAQTYPGSSEEIVVNAYKCFFQSLSVIIPGKNMKKAMKDFINMDPSILKMFGECKELDPFFETYKGVYKILVTNPHQLFDQSFQNSDTLFAWTYLLRCYITLLEGSVHGISNCQELQSVYDVSNISKDVWGSNMWKLIHYCAFFAPKPMTQEWNVAFKAFMVCLQYCLPCALCKNHLKENLHNISVDSYKSVFEYTVDLHNIVNKQLHHPTMSLEEATRLYSPHNQRLVAQNASTTFRH